jgi:hypothetical protein
MAAPRTTVVGAVAFGRDIERMSAPGGALDKASTSAAEQVLRPAAATTRGSIPRVSGAMAATVAVKAEPYGAVLSEGGDSVAYAGWVDFGGSRPQSGPRPYLPQGRYLFPAVGDIEPAATAALSDAYSRVLASYGWTNTTSDGGQVHD